MFLMIFINYQNNKSFMFSKHSWNRNAFSICLIWKKELLARKTHFLNQHKCFYDAVIYEIIILSHALIFLHLHVQQSICSKHIRFIDVFAYTFLVAWTRCNIAASNYAFSRCKFRSKTLCFLNDFINFQNQKTHWHFHKIVENVTYFQCVWFQNELLARKIHFLN